MSSPLEQFSNLSLGSPMATSVDADFEKRKFIIQDILSSFQRNVLPSEYRIDIFSVIHREQQARASEWTLPEDLEGSLAQRAAHDEQCFEVLQSLQPERDRSRLFHEKVARRLQDEFDKYQILEEERTGEIRQQVLDISNSIWEIVEAARERQETFDTPVSAGPIIKALLDVCESNVDLAGGTNRTRASLFHLLIRDPQEGRETFMLDLLEWISTNHPTHLRPQLNTLTLISGLLSTLNAPDHYQHTFNRIVEAVSRRVDTESPPGSPPQPPPPPPPSAPGGSGAAGKKRRATDTPGRKGGKRKTVA
jgi:hypothetical protein